MYRLRGVSANQAREHYEDVIEQAAVAIGNIFLPGDLFMLHSSFVVLVVNGNGAKVYVQGYTPGSAPEVIAKVFAAASRHIPDILVGVERPPTNRQGLAFRRFLAWPDHPYDYALPLRLVAYALPLRPVALDDHPISSRIQDICAYCEKSYRYKGAQFDKYILIWMAGVAPPVEYHAYICKACFGPGEHPLAGALTHRWLGE